MRVRRKPGLRLDDVIIPHTDASPAHPVRIMIACEGEMVMRVEPAMVGCAETGKGADFETGLAVDHIGTPETLDDHWMLRR